MPKRRYALAVICYLAIPVVLIAGAGLFQIIDPEMARGHADYVRDYHLLELVRLGVLAIAAGLALVLWVLCCYLVLTSRQRSLFWLASAAAGPFGFSLIAALEDRSPATDDHYQHFIRNLKIYWRVPLEIGVFIAVWFLAYESVVVERELMIVFESFRTGTPVSSIIALQNASSGMWAAGEGMEQLYLVVLIYLLWSMFINLACRFLKVRLPATQQSPTYSGK